MLAFCMIDQEDDFFRDGDKRPLCLHQRIGVFKGAARYTERSGRDKGYVGVVLGQCLPGVSHNRFRAVIEHAAGQVCLDIFFVGQLHRCHEVGGDDRQRDMIRQEPGNRVGGSSGIYTDHAVGMDEPQGGFCDRAGYRAGV